MCCQLRNIKQGVGRECGAGGGPKTRFRGTSMQEPEEHVPAHDAACPAGERVETHQNVAQKWRGFDGQQDGVLERWKEVDMWDVAWCCWVDMRLRENLRLGARRCLFRVGSKPRLHPCATPAHKH